MNYLKTEPESTVERNDNRRKAALGGVLGGLGLMGAALVGMSAYEAETPQDAIGSVAIADKTYFVTPEELPFIALGAIGAIAVIASAEYLRKPYEE